MSTPIKKPPLVNTSQDPGLEYLNQREIDVVITPTENSTKNVVYEEVTKVITNIFQVNAPTGANGQIQFNQNGQYIGDNELQYDPNTDTLTTGKIVANTITITGNANSLKLNGGYNNDVLKTDGTGNLSWGNVFPSVAGNTGKFLVTNGVSINWSNVNYNSLATTTFVSSAIANLVGTAPAMLDTLGEIANIIGQTNDPQFGIISQLANKANISNLAQVAFSGSYSDLSYKPTISTAGRTGNYADLNGKPTIPATITDLGISDGSNGQVLTTYGNGKYHFTTVTSGSNANIGNIKFNNNIIYSNTGVVINNSDLGNGQTAGMAIPVQGDGNAVSLYNAYGNVNILAGNIGNSQPVQAWTFNSAGALFFPQTLYVTSGIVVDDNNQELSIGTDRGNISIWPESSKWLFRADGNLALPQGSIIGETANSTTITPPNALAGQGLVVRLTGVQGITSDHPSGFTDGDTITLTVTPDNNGAPVTGTVDYTFTGATSQQLGRALTGTLTFNNEGGKTIAWTIPVSSTMTTFTITLSNASGFGIGGISPLTLTTTGSSEDHHIHLIAGDPSITDIYLGDDDQYVKIEKNGGNVVIGTSTNAKRWRFDTDGNLTLPTGGNLIVSGSIVSNNVYTDNYYYANGAPLEIPSGNTSVTTTGNVTAGNVIAGNFSGNGSQLTSIAGANVTGQVSNSLVAGTVYTNAQPNITSLGNLTSVRVTGNANVGGNLVLSNTTQIVSTPGSNGNITLDPDGTGVVNVLGNVVANNFSGNISITGNVIGTSPNVTLVAGSYSYTFDNTGNFTLPANSDILMTGTNSILSAGGTTLLGGYSQIGGYYSTLGVKYAGAGTQFGMTLQPTNDNTTAIQFLNAAGTSIGNIKQTSSTVQFVGDGSQLSNVATQTTGSWTLSPGTNTVSLSVPINGTYSIWVRGNIPSGIVTYTATVVVTNTNVPVVGTSYGWYYVDGNQLVLTAIPAQIVGTLNNISTATVSTTTANVFTFGITNNSGASAVVSYGYTKLG